MKIQNLSRWRERLVIAATLCGFGLLLVINSSHVGATAGGLDGAFGTGGKAFAHFTNEDDIGYAVAVQNDGKIVVAGQTNGSNFAVARFNVNGAHDMTFDGDGMAVTDFAGQVDIGRAIAIQEDGKIIVVGDTAAVGNSPDFAVARYNSNGSLDTSFDLDGKVITEFAGQQDSANAVAIQDDGKIVVAGFAVVPVTAQDFGVVRYDANGALDSTFGTGGKLTVNVLGSSLLGYDNGTDLAIQDDGKIVVVGSTFFDPYSQFALIRCNTNGTLDDTFGSGGRVTTLVGNGQDSATGVVIQPDGKIVVGGGTGSVPTRFCVARYGTNGSLDGTFGSVGVAVTVMGSAGYGPAHSLALQADGKIVLVGAGFYGVNGPDFAVARFNPNGSLDGKAVTPIGSLNDVAYGMAIQSDGRIVAAGTSFVNGARFEISVARYDLVPLHSPPRRFDFDGDAKSDLAVVRPSTGFWYIGSSLNSNITSLQYNQPNDISVPADYNGDAKFEIANFRNGDWRVLDGGGDVHFGQIGDVPVPGDYDGDTLADFAVFREGAWYIKQTRDGEVGFGFGISTDKAVPEDYDGDGKYDPAVYRDGIWYILNSTAGFSVVQFGLSTDRPVPADYDGDDKADVAVYRSGTWYILGSTSGFRAVQFGISTDIPVPADYDADLKADIAVFRDGYWYMLRSSDGAFSYVQFGMAGDIPLPAVYLR